jgi:hypothetical protein
MAIELPPPAVTPIESYSAEALSKILNQYRESPKLKGLVTAGASGQDELEIAFNEIRDRFYLKSAEGVQLDTIGAIFGLARLGDDDETYRARLRAFAARRFSGTPNEILNSLRVFFGATYAIYVPVYPAGFSILTDAVLTKADLEALSPAGVGVGVGGFLVDANNNPIVTAIGSNIYAVGGN